MVNYATIQQIMDYLTSIGWTYVHVASNGQVHVSLNGETWNACGSVGQWNIDKMHGIGRRERLVAPLAAVSYERWQALMADLWADPHKEVFLRNGKRYMPLHRETHEVTTELTRWQMAADAKNTPPGPWPLCRSAP